MSLVDTAVGLLAPHQCIACGREGSVLCASCLETAGEPIAPRCGGCKKLSDDWQTCQGCKAWIRVDRLYVSTVYDGMYEHLLRTFKFDVQRSAVRPIAMLMKDILPLDDLSGFTICPLPTAPARVRERGFDHTKLLGRELSATTGLKRSTFLKRYTNARQLGATRSSRMQQMQHEFYVPQSKDVKGSSVLLIDDVVTTGASVSAATRALQKAGAKQVYAVVFAQKI